MKKNLLLIIAFFAWMSGILIYSQSSNDSARETLAKHEKNLNDPTAPPILSAQMRSSSWTVRYWLGVDKKSSDCTQADEIMDAGGNVRILTKRGSEISRNLLSDYISSCQNRRNRSIEMVDRPAKKWCAFRDSDPRLATICDEWTNNRDEYLASIERIDSPTLERYKSYPNK